MEKIPETARWEEEQYHYVLPDPPTRRVGAPPLDKFEKVKHTEPMLSPDNAFSHDEVREFNQRVKCTRAVAPLYHAGVTL